MRLRQPGGGDLDRQRQVADRLGDLTGLLGGNVGQATGQVLDTLGPLEDIDLECLGPAPPAEVAGGDQDVTGAAGQVADDVVGLVDVVEDQQPARGRFTAAERLTSGLHGHAERVTHSQAEPFRQFGEGRGDQLGLFGVDPPHQVVVGREAVRVLQGDLGLADPTETQEYLDTGRSRPGPAAEPVAQQVQGR